MGTKVKTASLSLVAKDVTNAVKSFELSKKYIRKFLNIGTLNIIYRRIDVPESEFEPKNYESVAYMLFKRKSSNKFIRNYHFFMHGILDAFEKDYLKDIFMYIRDKHSNEVLETYTFKVKYNRDAGEANTKPKKVRDATVEFLQCLGSIPGEKLCSDKVELYMEFRYNEETPRDYEPPNFEPAKEPLCLNLHSNQTVALGSINTGFHKLSAHGRGSNFMSSRTTTPAPSSYIDEDLDSEDPANKQGIKRVNNKVSDVAENKKLKTSEERTKSPFINITSETNVDNVTIVSSEEYISCVCRWDLPKEFETTRCTKCFGIVHLVCHGYITLNALTEENFLCYLCAEPKANRSKSANMNLLIKLRIILYGIYLRKELPIELKMTSGEERQYILVQLDKLGVYSAQAKNEKDVDLTNLSEAMLTAFKIEDSQYFQ